jgi:LPS sulfotransferase NodH
MKRAFLVIGAESTGTRLVTRILLSAGCTGSADHFQPFDRGPIGDAKLVVWRRSVPHSGQPLDLPGLRSRLKSYDIHALITIRDWTATSRSQVRNNHARSLEVFPRKLRLAYASIFEQLAETGTPFTFIVYESLVLHPRLAQLRLLEQLGLDAPRDLVQVQNQNRKWLQ